jgi:dolichyl-phosphate-mannose--protein O-mannosyl transferase
MARKRASQDEEFLASLADGSLYSMGAFFSDQHPELVDEVIAQAEGIEQRGLRGYAEEAGMSVEEAYETLMTGLAVRYYKAVAG